MFEIKINNRAGEKYTKVGIPYSKIEKITGIKAYIKDRNGIIVKELKNKDIVKRSIIPDYSFYADEYIKEFILKHNEYPYNIVYSYHQTGVQFLYLDYWEPVIDSEVPTKSATLKLEVPADYEFAFNNTHIDDFRIDTSRVSVQATWYASYKETLKSETLSPPLVDYYPSVILTPKDFIFDIPGSLKSWQTYGNWQNEINQYLSDLPQEEINHIKNLVSDVEDEKEKIKILYHYLQDETRYLDVTIETGGLKPYPASYVANNKYGDCKALTNYFKSVLKAVSIESYYTKILAGNPIHNIKKAIPSQQFNHIILFIPLKNDTIWLDCTSNNAFGYLGTFTQNREALVVEKDKSFFIHTPALSDMDVMESRTVHLYFEDDKNGMASFRNLYKGKKYEMLYHLSQNYNESEKSQIIRNYFIEKGFEIKGYELKESHRDSAKISLSYTAGTSEIFKKYNDAVLIKMLPFSIPLFEIPSIRKLPVQMDYPIYKKDTLTYIIPRGYKVTKENTDKSIINKYGKYSVKYYYEQNKVRIIKNFVLKPGFYPVEEYEAFYNFIEEVREIENNSYIITGT